MAREEEAALVQRLREGDEQAFALLIDRHYGGMLRLAKGLCPNPATAEEVVQESWLAVLSALERFEGRSSLKTWIYAILTNQARKRAQKDRRFASWLLGDMTEEEATGAPDCASAKVVMSPWPLNAEEKVMRDGVLEIVGKAIEELPSNQRTVVILRDVEGLDAAEVCAMLEISDSNQRVLLHRGRVRIRNVVDGYLNPRTEVAR